MYRKDAIEVIKKNWPDSSFTRLREALETLIPELKENEDEIIRKWIKKELESKYVVDNIVNNEMADKAFAWLEKQDGQNHTDNVKPEFKVDDWIINTITNEVEQVIELTDCEYICSGHLIVSFGAQHILKRWTIQDAKDGDVLCSNQIIILFKQWEDNTDCNFVIAHAGIDISGKLQITDGHWLIHNQAKPATKEQRDLLFQKMKEADYVWDEEKKELKKNNYKDPYEQCIQYASIEDGIKAHAETYSFNIESKLFNQLTKEQQTLWRKELEQAVISGGEAGVELARDARYQENVEVAIKTVQHQLNLVDKRLNPLYNDLNKVKGK